MPSTLKWELWPNAVLIAEKKSCCQRSVWLSVFEVDHRNLVRFWGGTLPAITAKRSRSCSQCCLAIVRVLLYESMHLLGVYALPRRVGQCRRRRRWLA